MIYIQFNQGELIKSPLNYIGSKYKLLPQIFLLFPERIDTFFDLFCGGCNVGVNVNANKIVCNDIISQTINFFNVCQLDRVEDMLKKFQTIIDIHTLSRTNKEGYINLKKIYNKESINPSNSLHIYMFYMLIAHSFSNQIRFNKKGEFNLPFGNRTFNDNMKGNFIKFANKIKTLNISFTNNDFRKFNSYHVSVNDFIYIDSPYLTTTATYNENKGWSKKDDLDLFELIDNNIHKQGIKFAMSNIYRTDWLKEWSRKYNIHYLNYNYKNCNYQKKDKSGQECEVLITNY